MNAIKTFRTVPVVVIVQLLSRVLLFVTPWTAPHQKGVRHVRTVPGTWQPRYKCFQSLPSSPCHYQPRPQHRVIILTRHHHHITSPSPSPYCHHRHHLISSITAITIIFATVIMIVKYLLRPYDKPGSENSRH